MLLVAALMLAGPSPAAERQPPTELWEEYPLGETTRAPTRTTPPSIAPAGTLSPPAATQSLPRTPAPDRAGEGLSPWLVTFAGAAAVPVALLAVLHARRRDPRRRDAPQKGASMLKRRTQRQQPIAPRAAADSIPLMDMSAYSLRERSDTVAEHDERVEHDEQPAAAPPPPEVSGFDQVGTHVAAVLQAAQESADRIVAGARERAAKLVESAGAQAKQRLDEARAEEERISSEVARLRGEAESYAAARRADVENEMRALRGEAEREARELREAAEELADRLEREARERQAQLRQLEGEVEERLRAAWDTAREVGTRIGSLLDGRRAPEDEPTRRDASSEESQAVSSGA